MGNRVFDILCIRNITDDKPNATIEIDSTTQIPNVNLAFISTFLIFLDRVFAGSVFTAVETLLWSGSTCLKNINRKLC